MTSLEVGLETLRANPMRTILSALGVVIGVAALVAVLSLGDGMERFGREQIAREGANVVAIEANAVETVDGVRVARAGFPVLGAADAAEVAGGLPAGTQVTMQMMGGGVVTGPHGGRRRGTYVTGLLPSADHPSLRAAHGRMLTVAEAAAGAPVVVLSPALADSLAAGAGGASLVGQPVRFGDDPAAAAHTVIGVLEPVEGMGSMAVVPITGAAALMGPAAPGSQRAPSIHLHATGVDAVAGVRDAAERWAASRWSDWKREVTVSSMSARRLSQLTQGVLLFKMFMGAIASISLVVGGIGIMNVLLASVTERTREIGIRKTAGARDRDIMRQFLAESVVVSGAGSVVGVVLGLAGAFGATALMRAQTEAQVYAGVTVRTLLLAALASVLVGLIFGTYPARRAARLSPIDAIRHEG